jgi:hypothetical protein
MLRKLTIDTKTTTLMAVVSVLIGTLDLTRRAAVAVVAVAAVADALALLLADARDLPPEDTLLADLLLAVAREPPLLATNPDPLLVRSVYYFISFVSNLLSSGHSNYSFRYQVIAREAEAHPLLTTQTRSPRLMSHKSSFCLPTLIQCNVLSTNRLIRASSAAECFSMYLTSWINGV